MNRSVKFTTRSAAEMGGRRDRKWGWHKLVWGKGATPRHAFILWFAVHQKLLTQDWLQRKGVSVASRYLLCRCAEEILDHLFFTCSFSLKIWFFLGDKCGAPRADRSWENLINWSLAQACLLPFGLPSPFSPFLVVTP